MSAKTYPGLDVPLNERIEAAIADQHREDCEAVRRSVFAITNDQNIDEDGVASLAKAMERLGLKTDPHLNTLTDARRRDAQAEQKVAEFTEVAAGQTKLKEAEILAVRLTATLAHLAQLIRRRIGTKARHQALAASYSQDRRELRTSCALAFSEDDLALTPIPDPQALQDPEDLELTQRVGEIAQLIEPFEFRRQATEPNRALNNFHNHLMGHEIDPREEGGDP